jgi:hypothetical protein
MECMLLCDVAGPLVCLSPTEWWPEAGPLIPWVVHNPVSSHYLRCCILCNESGVVGAAVTMRLAAS